MFRSILILFLFIASLSASAQNTIVLEDTLKEYVFGKRSFEYLEDKEKKWSINDITSESFKNKFKLDTTGYVYNEHINSAYWIKFKVKNNSKTGKTFILESFAPHTNDWQVFFPSGDKFNVKRLGIDHEFYDREYVNKNLILDLPLDTSNVSTFYMRVESKNFSSFDFRIKPSRYFFFYSVNEYYFLGIFYGILLIMAVYNLLLYFSIWERVYIFYVLYLMCGMLTTLAEDSLGYQFVWTKFTFINSYVGSHIAPLLLLLSIIFYSREFLQLKNFPKYNKIVLLSVAGYFIYYALKVTVLPAGLISRAMDLLPLVVVYAVALIRFFKGYKPARFFIIGYTFILISLVIMVLRSNGTIQGNLFTVYSFNYGLVLEAIILSFALADRFKYAKKEREDALKDRAEAQKRVIKQLRVNQDLKDQVNTALNEKSEAQQKIIEQLKINEELKDKVNKELEGKVVERTKELHEKNAELEVANVKLKEMTDKANQMSIKLDVDNWDLKKKVNDSIKSRMVGEEVSYEEFQKIFSDEAACFRYLYDLKWEASYSCHKCRSSEFVDDGFARKCVKCAYYESVTAHTLFHGIKFPINKAFYIAYLTVHKKDKITLDELSELLDMRRNTAWKFKTKIFLAMDSYKRTHNTEIVRSWEDIVFDSKPKKKSK